MYPFFVLLAAHAAVLNFETLGAKSDDSSAATELANGALLNKTLNSLSPGDTLLVPNKTFHVMGGIIAHNVTDVTFQLDGTLAYSERMENWPRWTNGEDGKVLECFEWKYPKNVTITSSGKGTFDGHGSVWWGIPFIGYLDRVENRPKLMTIHKGKDILMENIFFKNSPYWTVDANVENMEIRNCDIVAKRDNTDGHDLVDISAFNTDGFDVEGKNVWIHDCNIWNQDDCIAVKGKAQDMVFERINASGFGLTIGSMGGGDYAKNITFRDCYMHKTAKGIYMKFNGNSNGAEVTVIENILYENIVMDEPSGTAIWIGPAQQSDSRNLCAAHPCSICWPKDPFAKCSAPAFGQYTNVTLRNIVVNSPKRSPGLIFANDTRPAQNVVFDNVVVNNPAKSPWKDFYYCKGVVGVATGNTNPVPPCFKDETGPKSLARYTGTTQ